jgi:lantibiotic modifying enzyme
MSPKPFSSDFILQICQKIVDNGRSYSRRHNSSLPLMYEWHGSEYLGAAHGVSGILLTLLMSPWFEKVGNEFPNVDKTVMTDVKASIDQLLEIQDADGNWPTKLQNSDKKLVHWCHGAAGLVYLFAKSYVLFGEGKYLDACKLSADLVWEKGLLYKGPGICHGVGGSGFVFLLMYRLTNEAKYLYRATKFAEFLTNTEFRSFAKTPDRPYSLYEGTAGTICFLLGVLEPEKAAFPFMDIY